MSNGLPTPMTPAPIGFGPGGPLPYSSPWTIYGNYIGYAGGVVIGSPSGGSKGPGTLNATSIFLNGQPMGNYLPMTGGTVTGNLVVTGTVTATTLDGAAIDLGTF